MNPNESNAMSANLPENYERLDPDFLREFGEPEDMLLKGTNSDSCEWSSMSGVIIGWEALHCAGCIFAAPAGTMANARAAKQASEGDAFTCPACIRKDGQLVTRCASCNAEYGKAYFATPPAREPEAGKEGLEPSYYIASKTRYAGQWRVHREDGARITSTWIDEAEEGQTTNYAELAFRCLSEIKAADYLILYCGGANDEELKGALIEAGMALALGKRVRQVGDGKSISRVFREHPLWSCHGSIQDACDDATRATPATPLAGQEGETFGIMAMTLNDVQDVISSPGRLPDRELERIRRRFFAHSSEAALERELAETRKERDEAATKHQREVESIMLDLTATMKDRSELREKLAEAEGKHADQTQWGDETENEALHGKLAAAILGHAEEVARLNEKLAEAEREKAEIRDLSLNIEADKDMLGVAHLEVVQQLTDLRAQLAASESAREGMRVAAEECRDNILNGRGPLEATLDSDQTNAVLGVFDDAFQAALATPGAESGVAK